MWIVRLALRRPYTFVVAALVLLLLTPFVLLRTPTDIFPSINIPVVSIVWQYGGLNAQEIEQRILYSHERMLSVLVDNIEHIESTAYNGIGVIKVFLREGTSVDGGVAQMTAIAQTILRQLPPGTTPPLIIRYSASTVPILQYSIAARSSPSRSCRHGVQPGPRRPGHRAGRVHALALRRQDARRLGGPRPAGAQGEEPGAAGRGQRAQRAEPHPAQRHRQNRRHRIRRRAQRAARRSWRSSTICPSRPSTARSSACATSRRCATATSRSRTSSGCDGVRGALLTIFKSGAASTLDVVSGVKAAMPRILSGLPPDLEVKEFADQSIFVRSAICGVVREGVIAAALTALMILLFLGSWRSTLIIALSIPLSVLASIAILSALGETINLMTLGGLALAVGILVDDATVDDREHPPAHGAGQADRQAILDGAQEIAMPAFVSTLCICIVFVPMFFLTGVAHYLFVPLAEAVVFAMLASYVLSRTLVPTLVMWFYRNVRRITVRPRGDRRDAAAGCGRSRRSRAASSGASTASARATAPCSGRSCTIGRGVRRRRSSRSASARRCCCCRSLGQDFFPSVDAGQFRLHLRARSGTRIEETAKLVDEVEAAIRREIPAARFARHAGQHRHSRLRHSTRPTTTAA